MKYNIPILVLSTMLFGLAACSGKAVESVPGNTFCLSDTMQQKIKLDTVRMEPVKNSISLSGKIEADEDKWIKVYPVVGGVVEEMKVNLGDYVTKGQTLVVIRSSEIADYQGQLTFAQSAVRIAEKNLSSSREMLAGGLATEKDVVAAETDLDKAKADLKRIQQTNAIYGSRPNAIQTITAPMSGYIIEKNVTEQMHYRVDGNQPFFVIANLEEVWVMANVFENDIARIRTGYDADIRVIAYPDKVFHGKVDRIFNILDPQSRVMKVRITIPNKDHLIKPEMFARINITYQADTSRMTAIPAGSIIFDKNKNYVMVYKDRCRIDTREVELYDTIGDKAYIRAGLQEGERIISQYQLLVYDALND